MSSCVSLLTVCNFDAALLPPSISGRDLVCSPPPVDDASVVDIALGTGVHGSLVSAVRAAGLDETLSGDGPFTLFAPTDQAFASLLADFDATALSDLDPTLVETVLKYHIIPAKASFAESTTGTLATDQGGEVCLTVEPEHVMVNGIPVSVADLEAGNGVVHLIDEGKCDYVA